MIKCLVFFFRQQDYERSKVFWSNRSLQMYCIHQGNIERKHLKKQEAQKLLVFKLFCYWNFLLTLFFIRSHTGWKCGSIETQWCISERPHLRQHDNLKHYILFFPFAHLKKTLFFFLKNLSFKNISFWRRKFIDESTVKTVRLQQDENTIYRM